MADETAGHATYYCNKSRMGTFWDTKTTVRSEEICHVWQCAWRPVVFTRENPHVTKKTMYTGKYGQLVPCHPRETTAAIRQFANRSLVHLWCHRRSEQSGHWFWVGRMLLGIFVINRGRSCRPRRHPLVNLIEIFRLGKSADLVRRRVCTQHYTRTSIKCRVNEAVSNRSIGQSFNQSVITDQLINR